MIELQHVTKNYGEKTAVNDLSLVVPPGELFAFLGPNGAGKTTTIKLLVGLLQPSRGSLKICGYDLANQKREACRCLGYVPDEPYLYDKLTGREFLQFVAEMYGMSPKDREKYIQKEVDHFELAPFLDSLTETYSLGMKQRLVFAAALVHQPRVVVLDEPMVGLDPKSARITKDLLKALARGGATIFMSTHTLAVVEEIADKIGIISQGKLLFHGTLETLRERLHAGGGSLEKLFLELTQEG